LHESVCLIRKGKIPKTKFFLRSETYYNVASELEELSRDPIEGELAFASYGGKSLHTRSHGEGLLSIIENRFGREGFYLLDEPEAGVGDKQTIHPIAGNSSVGQGWQSINYSHPFADIDGLSRSDDLSVF
jgi:predicted ATPase